MLYTPNFPKQRSFRGRNVYRFQSRLEQAPNQVPEQIPEQGPERRFRRSWLASASTAIRAHDGLKMTMTIEMIPILEMNHQPGRNVPRHYWFRTVHGAGPEFWSRFWNRFTVGSGVGSGD